MAKSINLEKEQIMNKLRWGLHPENTALSQLEIKRFGFWYKIPGTTVLSTAEKLKAEIWSKYDGQ